MDHVLFLDSDPIREAQKKYFSMNDFLPDGGASDKWARYKLGPFSLIAFPNFNHRIEAIRRHDIHHIVNDLDASNLGEGLIAAWELGSGCGRYWISWFLESQALWYGILMAPRQTWSRFLVGRNSRNFYRENFSPNVFDQTVGSLRRTLLPSETTSLKGKAIDIAAFASCAFLGACSMVLFFPIVGIFTVFGLIARY